ncbi:hypothetical protein [Streptomyces telluris]|uniref:hypothetical protein n=1 Tax=Streptomyces telluris TaxID=2720021 RepID=UPI0035591426
MAGAGHPAGGRPARHPAGGSRQVAHKAARIVAAEVSRFLGGKPLAHCANPEVLAA